MACQCNRGGREKAGSLLKSQIKEATGAELEIATDFGLKNDGKEIPDKAIFVGRVEVDGADALWEGLGENDYKVTVKDNDVYIVGGSGTGDNEYLWLSGYHYGDWLAMDAGEDSYVGATSNDLIASAFFINSIDILIKAGEILEKDVSEYKELHKKAIEEFHTYFMDNGMPKEELPFTEMAPEINEGTVDTVRKGITQTAIVLILHFNICYDTEREKLINKLEELIHNCGDRMSTGFLGTPYILHVLSNNGKSELAYKLLFNEKNPSWLYSVNNGATTMWEHWNGIKEDGSFWSTDMNSFNHYAYGAVGDWLYETIAGIRIAEEGYKKIVIRPMPDKRIGFVNSSIDTVNGTIVSNWYYCNECIHFEFIVPEGINARVMLPNGYVEDVCGGAYRYSTEVQ